MKLFNLYKILAIVFIVFVVFVIAILGYVLKQETDSALSVIAYFISGISLLISLISWNKIKNYLKVNAYKNHSELITEQS